MKSFFERKVVIFVVKVILVFLGIELVVVDLLMVVALEGEWGSWIF